MSAIKTCKKESNRKLWEVEANFANRSFDKLFREEKEIRKRSQSVISVKECENNDVVVVNNDLDEVDVSVFHQVFYSNIIARAKLLLQRKDKTEEIKGENPISIKTHSKRTLHRNSHLREKCLESKVSRSQSARKATEKTCPTVKESAENLTAEILELHCVPDRALPGKPFVLSHAERLVCGLDCDQVLPGVILASGKTVKNFAYMSQLRVTHIINTASRDVWLPVEKLSNLGVEMFQFHVDDVPSANIAPYFRPAADFVARATQAGGLLVINCLVGLSRSATVLAAALMINNKWTAKRSLKIMRNMRPVKPNMGFMVQLLTLETQLRGEGIDLV